MIPRLKTSTKWTRFPKELESAIAELFTTHFGKIAKSGTFLCEGRIYPDELLFRIGHHRPGELKQSNFEISHFYKQEEFQAAIDFCVDLSSSLVAEHFEAEKNDEEADFPRVWREIEFENQKAHFQFSTENSSLEAEADRLLGLDPDQLVHEDDET